MTVPQVPGTTYAIVITDEDGFVFEADELNNRVVVPIVVANYQLSFVQQPSATTQDFTMTPAVIVAVTHPDGGSVNAADVPGVTLAIANNPSAGTLTGTLFQPNSGAINANTAFADLRINNAGNGYTLVGLRAVLVRRDERGVQHRNRSAAGDRHTTPTPPPKIRRSTSRRPAC